MIIEGSCFPYKKMIKNLFEFAEKYLQEDFSNVCVSLNFVGGEEIKNLNNQFRQTNKQTDVLSFPNLEKQVDQKLTEFVSEIEGEPLFVGDVVICKKVAKLQAKEYGHSLKREICFLALHGLLHLLGYDHIEKEDEKLMNATAQKILTDFGAKR